MNDKTPMSGADIRAVVFDYDGTLVLSNDIKRDSFYDAAAGIPGGAEILDAIFASSHGDRYDVFARFANLMGDDDPNLARRLAEGYTVLCDDRIAAAPEVPGACTTLAALQSRGIGAWIASATPEAPLRASVRRRNLLNYLAGVFGLPTTKVEALRAVMSITKLRSEQLLMVGDAEADRAAAAAVGVPFIGIAGGVGGFVEPPPLMLEDLRELPDLLVVK